MLKVVQNSEMTSLERICVLTFDEMKVKKVYCYDKVHDETLKPYNYVQVCMIRGVIKNWKQPIYFDYDSNMTKEILFNIITSVEEAGFPVVSMTCDLGGSNRALHNSLDVSYEKPYFLNPTNDHKIYVLADVPHLLKLIRNNFVDHGFVLKGKVIDVNIIGKLLELTKKTDLSITHKISMDNVKVQGAQRQKVKLAAKLFSHSISSAISRCGMLGHFENEENWLECSKFFKLVNDWFDYLNVRVPAVDTRDRMKAYGLSLELQRNILTTMSSTIKLMRVKGKKFLMPFQKGIIMSNTAVEMLFEDVKNRFGIAYLLTYRLNQDVLENFFGQIRSKGGLHDHPNAIEFRYRLRSYILGRNEGSLSVAGNVEEDNTPDIEVAEDVLSGRCLGKLDNKDGDEQNDNPVDDIEDLEFDGLENLAGFISHKLKNIVTPDDESSGFSWCSHVSEGGYTIPSSTFVEQLRQLKKIFNDFNNDNLFICKNYLKTLLHLAQGVNVSEEVKSLFFRSRMYFRIRNLNISISNATLSRKRKLSKIVN